MRDVVISKDIFSNLLSKFDYILKNESKIAVAVSGGADSLCLAFLLKEWSENLGKSLYAFTVDHKFRIESNNEAKWVSSILTQNEIHHEILYNNEDFNRNPSQKNARNIRYNLLLNKCKEFKISILFLAHHAQDQTETFLMRLSKGSALHGLCCMQSINYFMGLIIIRPFIEKIWPKNLKVTLSRRFNCFYWIKDPSNIDLKFERVRWRNQLKEIEKSGISQESILKTVKHLQDSDIVIEEFLGYLIKNFLSISSYGFITVESNVFSNFSKEVLFFLLRTIFSTFNHQISLKQSRIDSIQDLITKLVQLKVSGKIFTLSGIWIQKTKEKTFFFRELRSVEKIWRIDKWKTNPFWDNRFIIKDCIKDRSLFLRALSHDGIKHLSTEIQSIYPYRALLTIPSIWKDNNTFVSIPDFKSCILDNLSNYLPQKLINNFTV